MSDGCENWLESRTGLPGIIRHFLLVPVPKRLGWPFCLGSMLLFLAVVQIGTGLVLTLNYAPTPDHAYQSVKALQTGVLFGQVVRAIHHWTASAMVLLAGLHMLRVIFWGSYKRPREVTWLIGVCLLLVTMAFSFTGYLMPWDQKAYWATVVGTRIAGSTPLIGDALLRILRGGEEVGASTLSRFFAVHVVLLPILLFGFSAIHLFLVRRHGSSGHWSLVEGVEAEKEPFCLHQCWRDIVAWLVVLGAIFALAIFLPPKLGPVANPADTQIIPRPEWYFLALFQILHYFTRHWEIMGTLIVPGAMVVLLFILPWLDRGIQRNPFRRPWVCGITLCVVLLTAYLGVVPILDDRHQEQSRARVERIIPTLSPALREGRRIYEAQSCDICHGIDGSGSPSGPSLFDLRRRFSMTYIRDHIHDPHKHNPRSDMPKTELSKKDMDLLVNYLLTLGRKGM